MATRKKTDTIQLSKIRMTEELRRKLAREAEKNGTTLNGEIVDRLEESFTIENIDQLLDRKIELTIELAITRTLKAIANSELLEEIEKQAREKFGTADFAAELNPKSKGG